MPNWCSNYLEITGEEKEIKKFCSEEMPNGKFDSEQILPTPKRLLETLSGSYGDERKNLLLKIRRHRNKCAFGVEDWYDWRLENLGTKWDFNDEYPDIDPTYITASFDTAWSPPEAFVYTIAERWPSLRFRLEYSEPGCDFAGYLDLCVEKNIEMSEADSYNSEMGVEARGTTSKSLSKSSWKWSWASLSNYILELSGLEDCKRKVP